MRGSNDLVGLAPSLTVLPDISSRKWGNETLFQPVWQILEFGEHITEQR